MCKNLQHRALSLFKSKLLFFPSKLLLTSFHYITEFLSSKRINRISHLQLSGCTGNLMVTKVELNSQGLVSRVRTDNKQRGQRQIRLIWGLIVTASHVRGNTEGPAVKQARVSGFLLQKNANRNNQQKTQPFRSYTTYRWKRGITLRVIRGKQQQRFQQHPEQFRLWMKTILLQWTEEGSPSLRHQLKYILLYKYNNTYSTRLKAYINRIFACVFIYIHIYNSAQACMC